MVPALSAVAATAPQDAGYVAAIGGRPFGDVDPWRFDAYECTSYVAYRLNQAGVGFSDTYDLPAGHKWSDAGNWISAAKLADIPSGTVPKQGAVAVWADASGLLSKGHVAFVTGNKGVVTFAEYNAEYYYPAYDPPGFDDIFGPTKNPSGSAPTEYLYFANVKAVPSAPTGLTVTRIGNGDVLLKWNPPVDKGGLAINSYEIDTSPNGKDWNVAFTVLPDLPEAVLNCSPGADCWYKVAAVTDAGLGLFRSAKAKNVPPGPLPPSPSPG